MSTVHGNSTPDRHLSPDAVHSPGSTVAADDLSWMPWAWCNLQRNPFGELTRGERAELAVVDADSILARVTAHRQAVQLIGDCGRGKTTRMLALQRSAVESEYVYLAEDEPCGAIPAGFPLLIDEAQRLPARARRALFASGVPLVLATHRDLGRPLRRAGYQVHTEHVGQSNDVELIYQVLNRRIAASRLGQGAIPRLTRAEADRLWSRFGSDIRSIEGFLYDRVQQQVFSHGEMRFVD